MKIVILNQFDINSLSNKLKQVYNNNNTTKKTLNKKNNDFIIDNNEILLFKRKVYIFND